MQNSTKFFSAGRLAFGFFLFVLFLSGNAECPAVTLLPGNLGNSLEGRRPSATPKASGSSTPAQMGQMPVTIREDILRLSRTSSVFHLQLFGGRSILKTPKQRIGGKRVEPRVRIGNGATRWTARKPFTGVAIVSCAGTDDTPTIAAAVTAARGKAIVIVKGQTCAVGDITIPNLRIEKGGLLKPLTSHTVILSERFDAEPYQAFVNALVGQGTVSFSGNKSIDNVNVLWWGAVPRPAADQTRDDTREIQAAFSSGAKKIRVPTGHYMIDAVTHQPGQKKVGLNLVSNTEVIMEAGTFLHVKNNSSVAYNLLVGWRVSNVIIRGGHLVGDNITNRRVPDANPSGYGLDLQGVTNVSVYDLVSQDMLADGFFICYDDEPGPHAESENVHLINCTGSRNYRQGVSVVGARNGSIEGGSYSGSSGSPPQDGIDIEPNVNIHGAGLPSVISDFTIRGVTATGNTGSGIEVNGEAGAGGVVRVDLLDNRTNANSEQGIVYRGATHGRIDHNTSNQNGRNGISVYHSTYIEVSQNICQGNGRDGIILQNPSGMVTRYLNVHDNTLSDNSVGIEVNGLSNTISDVTVKGNTSSRNHYEGIYLAKVVNGTVDGNTVSENSQKADNSKDNIFVMDSANSSISNNIVRRGNGANQPRYGINLLSGTDAIVKSNDLVTAGKTDAIKNAATRSVVSGNKISPVP